MCITEKENVLNLYTNEWYRNILLNHIECISIRSYCATIFAAEIPFYEKIKYYENILNMDICKGDDIEDIRSYIRFIQNAHDYLETRYNPANIKANILLYYKHDIFDTYFFSHPKQIKMRKGENPFQYVKKIFYLNRRNQKYYSAVIDIFDTKTNEHYTFTMMNNKNDLIHQVDYGVIWNHAPYIVDADHCMNFKFAQPIMFANLKLPSLVHPIQRYITTETFESKDVTSFAIINYYPKEDEWPYNMCKPMIYFGPATLHLESKYLIWNYIDVIR